MGENSSLSEEKKKKPWKSDFSARGLSHFPRIIRVLGVLPKHAVPCFGSTVMRKNFFFFFKYLRIYIAAPDGGGCVRAVVVVDGANSARHDRVCLAQTRRDEPTFDSVQSLHDKTSVMNYAYRRVTRKRADSPKLPSSSPRIY